MQNKNSYSTSLSTAKAEGSKANRGVKGGQVKFKPPVDATTAGVAGADPHPRFLYHGGAVVINPQVFAIYLGDWTSAASQGTATRLNQYLTDLVSSTYMNILSQYGCGASGNFIGSAFVGNANHNLHEKDIHQILQTAINNKNVPEPVNHNNAYVLFLDDSTGVKDKGLKIVMCEAKSDNAFGYHNVFTTAANNPCNYAIIPGLSDTCLNETCHGSPTCSLHTAQTQEQRRTQVASHEFSEMISNPKGDAWFDDSDGGENGDLCNGIAGTISVSGRTWTVQRMYSKADDVKSQGNNICVLPPKNPIAPLVANVARL